MVDYRSIMGYSKGSPWENAPYNLINTSQGAITMSKTKKKLKAFDANTGEFLTTMIPGKEYKFNTNKVLEIPVNEKGGWLDKYQQGGNTNRCPDGYYFDVLKRGCIKLGGNGRFNVDVYDTISKRSAYEPTDKTIGLALNSGTRDIPHEEAHAEQDRNGQLSTYSSAPINKGVYDLWDDDSRLYDRRIKEVDKLADDFKNSFLKAYPNRKYPKEFDLLSKDIKKLKVDGNIIYNIPGTVEYEAEMMAIKNMNSRNPKLKNVQLNFRGRGGWLNKYNNN